MKRSWMLFAACCLIFNLAIFPHFDASAQNADPIIKSIDWSPDGRMLAFADNLNIRLVDASNNRVIHTLPAFENSITDVQWKPDGTQLAIANGSEVQIWEHPEESNVAQAKLRLQAPQATELSGITSIDWHPTEEKILAVNTPKVYIWDTTSGELKQTLTSKQSAILSAAWSKDGQQIARGDAVGGIVVENLIDGSSEYSEFLDRNGVYAITWNPLGDHLAAGNGSGIIQIFTFDPFFTGTTSIETQTTGITSLDWNPIDNNLIATGSRDEKVIIWDVENQSKLEEIKVKGVPPIAWSPDGTQLAYADGDTLHIIPDAYFDTDPDSHAYPHANSRRFGYGDHHAAN